MSNILNKTLKNIGRKLSVSGKFTSIFQLNYFYFYLKCMFSGNKYLRK
jgi:hypothetical protein